LKRITDSTIVDADELWKAIKKIRREKVAVSLGEYIPDAAGIGAPVFNQDDKVVASIGIIAPISRVNDEMERFKEEVIKYSKELSVLLGNIGHK